MICPTAAPANTAVRTITLQPPSRDFGYFLGDVLTATAIITADPGTVLDRAALPEPGPVSRLIDIRHVDVSESDESGGKTYRIQIEYQSFYGPDAATQTEVPGYRLAFADGGQHFTADVPPWHFTASALRHEVVAVTDVRALRPDHAPAPLRTGVARLRLAAGSALAVLAGFTMLVRRGVVPALGAARRPFTGAARRLRHRLRGNAPADRQDGAFLELHRAFDATAGHALLAADIDQFIAGHPRFMPLRQDIAQFFTASQQRFFGACNTVPAVTDAWLLAFSRRLARAERA